jgi:hypothetical protein
MKKLLLSITLFVAFLFTATAQVPNGFMENWVATAAGGQGEEPTGWATTNVLSSFFLGNNPVSITKVVDSHSGFAAKITTIRQTNNQTQGTVDDTTGFMLLGSINPTTGELIPVPYTYPTKPNSLIFRSKYNPNGVDTAVVAVLLFKWNTVLSKRDTLGEGYYVVGANQSSYVLSTALIDYSIPAINPDSMLIFAIASFRDTITGQYPKVGSTFYVDHFYFDITSGIENDNVSTSVNVYPNPSTFAVNFQFDNAQPKAILVYDMQGKLIENVNVNSDKITLSTEKWAKGMYSYSLIGLDNAVLKAGKFQVQ